MYHQIVDRLNELLCESALEQGLSADQIPPAIGFSPTKDYAHGDLSTNAALALAKALKKNPRDLAAIFTEKLQGCEFLSRVETAGPGFINVRLADSVIEETLAQILQQKHEYGRSKAYQGKRALIEFVSANPTGPLHVGHVRGAIVGDTAASLLEAVGYEVTREYYYNDAGVQMQMLGLSVRARYLELFGREGEFPEDGYRGDYIRYIAAGLKAARGDELIDETHWKPFTDFAASVLMNVIMDDLRRLRVYFDATFSEQSLHDNGKVHEVLDRLAKLGATYAHEKAVWLRTTERGDEKDGVLVKSDGEPTYVTPDIAYHVDKYERGYDLIVNVMGHDHHSQVERVKIALDLFGEDLSKLHYLLNQMVSIQRSGEKIKLSTRQGQFMTLAEMVDELGADVTRYFYAQRSYNTQMVFDWDLARQQSMDNPVYYLQYLHARACSMHDKARERGIEVTETLPGNVQALRGERERFLMMQLFYFPHVVRDAADKLEAHLAPAYLEDLAKTFHHYYQAQRVLDQDDMEGSTCRMYIVEAVRQTVANGLQLLNVTAPERM